MRLNGKVALITGAGTGIGAATAELFGRHGAMVSLMGRRKSLLEKVAKRIQQESGDDKALVIPGDVSRAEDGRKAVSETLKKWKRLDILVNNAGIISGGLLHQTTEKEWDKVLGINAKGIFLMTQAAIEPMIKQKKGAIVNVSSILGLIAMPECGAYNASKGAVLQLTRSTAMDYAKEGIRCNAVCPGGVDTPMLAEETNTPERRKQMDALHPIGRMGQPLDVAYAIVYLASEEASWVTGAVLPVDGGYTAQ